MAATKLGIYNKALGYLGERKLASLTEAREPRRVLDDYYSGAIAHCLEMGDWKFALRSLKRLPSDSVSPDFGFSYAFSKPTDLVRLTRISESADLELPLLRYREEDGHWYADVTPIYLEYVSDSSALGGLDLSRWSQLFEDYVALHLTRMACPRISGETPSRPDEASKLEKLEAREARALDAALKHNAVNEAPAPDVVQHCLEQAAWKFAIKTSKISPTGGAAPAFGFTKAFQKPSDWVRTIALSDNEYLDPPLTRVNEESGWWQADCSFLYARYVSNGTAYGLNRAAWPQSFKDYVEARAAVVSYMLGLKQGGGPIKGGQEEASPLAELHKVEAIALIKAIEHNNLGEQASPDIVKHCLEQAAWKFALRTSKISPTGGQALAFGFDNAFAKPSDWVRTVTISDNEYQNPPLARFLDQTNYWHADASFLYVTYVSNNTSYGADQTKWTQSFKDYVTARAALVTYLAGPRPADDKGRVKELQELELLALARAVEHNALGDGVAPDIVKHCLETAPWKFALKISQIAASASVTPAFGFENAFVKPADWVATITLSDNESFSPSLARFSEEKGHWHADCDPLYLRYISSHADYGADQSKWPQLFKDYVEARSALLTYKRRADARVDVLEKLERMEKKALGAAREHNALVTAPQFSPRGSWVSSRGGADNSSRWDGRS